MVAALQHVWNSQPFKIFWPRIVRILQQTVRKTFVIARFFFAHKAGHKPGNSFKHRKGRAFAAVEHNVAHTHRLKRKQLQQPRVNALVPAANDGKVVLAREFTHHVLGQRAATGGHEQHAPGPLDGTQGARQRFALHDHAGAAAVRAVVHMAVFVGAELARIVKAAIHNASLPRTAHEGCGQGRFKKFGKKRDNVKTRHGRRVPQKRTSCKECLRRAFAGLRRSCGGTAEYLSVWPGA